LQEIKGFDKSGIREIIFNLSHQTPHSLYGIDILEMKMA